MDKIASLFHAIPPQTWLALLGAVGVTGVTQFLKKIFAIESKKIVQSIVMFVSLATAGVQYFLSQTNLPATILGVRTATLMGLATTVYIYALKPLSEFWVSYKAFKLRHEAEVTTLIGKENGQELVMPVANPITDSTVVDAAQAPVTDATLDV